TGRRGFDEAARDFVAPAIYEVALSAQPERRHMRGVLARVACTGERLDAWIAALVRSPHPELGRHAGVLRALSKATPVARIDRVPDEPDGWHAPPIAALIDRSDWTVDDLRLRATLYLCIERGDLDRYAPVLRTIVGQTIAALGRDKAISPSSAVTLFLDRVA